MTAIATPKSTAPKRKSRDFFRAVFGEERDEGSARECEVRISICFS